MNTVMQKWKMNYRNSKFSSRVISWLIILSVAAAFSYNFHWNYITVLIGTVSILIGLEILMFRPYLLSAATITLVFWFSFIVYMASMIEGLVYYYTENQLRYIEYSMYGGVLLGTVLILSSNWYIANGRYWVNLAISYILYLLGLALLPTVSLNPIYTPIVALIPIAIWVTMRKFWLYKRDMKVDIDKIPRTKNDTAFVKKISKDFPNSHIMTEDLTTIIYTGKNILVMLPVTPQDYIEISNRGIEMDSEDITSLMQHLVDKLSIISKASKINGRKMFPIIYITNSKLERGITPVSYKNKSKPDVTEGTVFFSNAKDFPRFVNQLTMNAPKMTEKEKSRYERLFKANTATSNK